MEQAWRVAAFDPAIRAKVAFELIAAWPIPVKREAGVGFRFFYYASFGPPPATTQKLYPPSWVVELDSQGSIADLRRVKPEEVGLNFPEGQPFATHSWPSWTVEAADGKRIELLRAYDAVVETWFARAQSPTREDAKLRADFRAMFIELTPGPLLPSYRTLGAEFFRWLDL